MILTMGTPHGHRHRGPRRRLILAAATSCRSAAQCADGRRRPAHRDAANRFVGCSTTDSAQGADPPSSRQWLDWHYIPRSRSGLTLGEHDSGPGRGGAGVVRNGAERARPEASRRRASGRRRCCASSRAASAIPAVTYVSVFGTPGRFPWGWRFEGHHHVAERALPAAGTSRWTPFFAGAHPATVRDGPHKGFRLLGASEDLARQIMNGLSSRRRRTALIADRSFGEIVASPQRESDLGQPRGLELVAMDGPSRQRVEALMDRFLATLAPEPSGRPETTGDGTGPWTIPLCLGGLARAGRGLLLPRPWTGHPDRADNTQNNANHVHSGVARPRRGLRPRRARRALSPAAAPLGTTGRIPRTLASGSEALMSVADHAFFTLAPGHA